MKKKQNYSAKTPLILYNITIPEKLYMGSRVCDNCGKTRDTYGAKTCSKGHFICKYCADGHGHCMLCGHSLR